MRVAQINNDLKVNNTLKVLNTVIHYSPMSRRDIQKKTDLSWGSVSTIINGLINNGILTETETNDTPVGRKPSMVDISSENNYIAGIDLNVSALTVVITDLKGRLITSKTKMLVKTDKDSIISSLFSLTDGVFKEVDGKKIITIGIASQGVVDLENGVSVYSPHFSNWNNVEICKICSERYDVPVYIFHDPDCVLYSEKFFADENEKARLTHTALIRLDKGVGMSMFFSGKSHRSSGNKATEIGHITMDANGPMCTCGKRGCLEVYVATKEITNRFLEKVNEKSESADFVDDPNAITYLTLRDAARRGNPICIEVFDTLGFFLGLSISHVINLFNPDEIILYGSIANIHDVYDEKMMDTISKSVYSAIKQPVIRYATDLSKDAAAIGGAILAFEMYSGEGKHFITEL